MHVGLYSPASTTAPSAPNGVVSYVVSLKRALTALGHKVSVFYPDWSGRAVEDDDSYPVRVTGRYGWLGKLSKRLFKGDSSGFPSDLSRAVADVHRSSPLDVFEMEESFGIFRSLFGSSFPLVVKLHGPAFLTLRDEDLASPAAQRRIMQEGAALRHARFLTAPSACALRDTVARYGLKPTIAAQIFNPLDPSPSQWRWTADRCDPSEILFVGRFDKAKGADRILHAMTKVVHALPQAKLTFVGPDIGITVGQDRLGFVEYLERTVPPSIRARIRFLGPLAPVDIPPLRQRAALTVVASRWESQGYTLLEAMQQGCPVVCSDAEAFTETVVSGQTGRIFVGDCVEDFARQVLASLTNLRESAGMAAIGAANVTERHSPLLVAQQTLDVYERAIAAFR